MKKSRSIRLLSVFLALFVAAMLVPTSAIARTVKTKTIPNGTKMSQFDKKIKAVKKGTTTIKYTTKYGFVKFKAPSTKTYKFTFSNVKSSNSPSAAVGALEKIKNTSRTEFTTVAIKVKTNEGTVKAFPVVDSEYARLAKNAGKTKIDKYQIVTKRTVKAKLKKGQTIYLDISGTAAGSLKLKIK